ncbi:sulfite exporter TauE/SafE family protein [Candidatus Woesearchaeota archaeon]|nr:sulfite exporter TauE/SafE family protein [Candidatus Woesearchaeota archaeon]
MAPLEVKRRDWGVFFCSVFFVLGFSVVFSLLGVLLQSVLASASYQIQKWLGRIGGVVIIAFGFYLMGLITIPFLERDHKVRITKKFGSKYAASFVFGAAFAVGWTPCVGAVLGAILTLAATQPQQAFFLMLSYSLGLGIPFLLVGLFTARAQRLIERAGKWISYLKAIFGGVLVLLGVLVFTNQLSRVANLAFASNFLISLDMFGISFGESLNIGIAFLAGIVSFLSPCILPLIPAFLSFLASAAVNGSAVGKKPS